MSRWIDADDALEVLNLMYDNQADKDDPYNVGVMGAINYIKHKAPSLEIVRCGECKYWKSTVQMPNGTEVKCLYGRKADDFCSYGSSSEKPNKSEIPTGSERSSE